MKRSDGSGEWLSAAAAAARLGVSVRTMRRYTDSGKLPDVRGAGGRRIFRAGDVEALTTREHVVGQVVLYARVSSRRQQCEGDLDRQLDTLRSAATLPVFAVYSDVASGLSDRRSGLREALSACQDPTVAQLLVTHPDRLARFGTAVIEHLLTGFGVQVVYVGESCETTSVESDLVRDMLAVVTSFAGRLYGQRSVRASRLRAAVRRETGGGVEA